MPTPVELACPAAVAVFTGPDPVLVPDATFFDVAALRVLCDSRPLLFVADASVMEELGPDAAGIVAEARAGSPVEPPLDSVAPVLGSIRDPFEE